MVSKMGGHRIAVKVEVLVDGVLRESDWDDWFVESDKIDDVVRGVCSAAMDSAVSWEAQ